MNPANLLGRPGAEMASQLDILNFDYDSEEEEEMMMSVGQKRGVGGKENAGGGEGGNAEGEEGKEGEVELELKKKARKKPRPFNEDVLTNGDGLVRIYEEFPVSVKFRGRGKEAEDLKRLLGMYKEWAFQLYPNLALPDILARCDTLGGKGKVRNHMEQLRDRERCRYLNEVLHVPLSEIRMKVLADVPRSPAPKDMTSPEATSPSFDDDGIAMDGELLASPVLGGNGPRAQLDFMLQASHTEGIFDHKNFVDEEEMLIAMAEEAEFQAAAKAKAQAAAPSQDDDALLFDGLDEDEDMFATTTASAATATTAAAAAVGTVAKESTLGDDDAEELEIDLEMDSDDEDASGGTGAVESEAETGAVESATEATEEEKTAKQDGDVDAPGGDGRVDDDSATQPVLGADELGTDLQ